MKRRKLVAFALLAVIGGVISFSLLRQSDEPEYQGRRLSEWLEKWVPRHGAGDGESEVAVRHIGTNALPYLVKWSKYESPAWRMNLRLKIPDFIKNYKTIDRWLEGEATRRGSYASTGFFILGTNATTAIPVLEALMKDSTKPESSERAIYALGCLGESAIPVLKAGLANPNQSLRWEIVYSLHLMSASQGTNALLPILLEALNDNLPKLRTDRRRRKLLDSQTIRGTGELPVAN